MLRHLSIRDFVIVAALDLEFDRGFTVFSGETGAGKSILIDALALALGARADAGVVRAGQRRADITAEFDAPAHVARWLDAHALAADAEMDECAENGDGDEGGNGAGLACAGDERNGNGNDNEHRGDGNGGNADGGGEDGGDANGGTGKSRKGGINSGGANGNDQNDADANSGSGKNREASENRADENTNSKSSSNADIDVSKSRETDKTRANANVGDQNDSDANILTSKNREPGESRTDANANSKTGDNANIGTGKNRKVDKTRANANANHKNVGSASIVTGKNRKADKTSASANANHKNVGSVNIDTGKNRKSSETHADANASYKNIGGASIVIGKNHVTQNASAASRNGNDHAKSDDAPPPHENHCAPDASRAPVLLRRVIDGNARSRAFINGTPVTLAQLREVGQMLVDIHGQHAHQLLMRADAQRELFDAHAGLTRLASTVQRAWRAWRDAAQAIESAHARERELQLERERLAWQLAELDKLAPQPGEWEEVSAEHLRLSHAASLIDGVQDALAALSEADDALVSRAGALASKLRGLAEVDPALDDVLAALEPAAIQLQEAAYSLSHYAQRLELDPARLAQVEKRLDALHSGARRFRLRPEALPAEHAARRAQLAALDAAADLDELRAAATRARDAYLAEARRLSAARAQAAKTLGAAVTRGMQELSMTGGRFEVALVPLGGAGSAGSAGLAGLADSRESSVSAALPDSVAPPASATLSSGSAVSSVPAASQGSAARLDSVASPASSTLAASRGSSPARASAMPGASVGSAGKPVSRGRGTDSAERTESAGGAQGAGNTGSRTGADGAGGAGNNTNRTQGAGHTNRAQGVGNTGVGSAPGNTGLPGGPHGLEQIEFRVAGHAGVPPRALAKVASGGELARISLALAVIASAASPTPTLIFDEVDSGIGGGVAEVVGRLLHQLGATRQVLCVTHLPQVAARGDHHCQVAKSTSAHGDTFSTVTPLDAPSRIEEIARMLGGLEITATTRRHAREMLAG